MNAGWWALIDGVLLVLLGVMVHVAWQVFRLERIARRRPDRRAVYSNRWYSIEIESSRTADDGEHE